MWGAQFCILVVCKTVHPTNIHVTMLRCIIDLATTNFWTWLGHLGVPPFHVAYFLDKYGCADFNYFVYFEKKRCKPPVATLFNILYSANFTYKLNCKVWIMQRFHGGDRELHSQNRYLLPVRQRLIELSLFVKPKLIISTTTLPLSTSIGPIVLHMLVDADVSTDEEDISCRRRRRRRDDVKFGQRLDRTSGFD